MNFKLPLGLTAKRSRSSQENNEEENDAKRVKIQNEGQELVVNCDIGRPRCLLCRLQSFHLKVYWGKLASTMARLSNKSE